MLLAHDDPSEEIVEVVEFRAIEILLLMHLLPPILERHGVDDDTDDDCHQELADVQPEVRLPRVGLLGRLVSLIFLVEVVVTKLSFSFAIDLTASTYCQPCRHTRPTLDYAPVDDPPVRPGLPAVASLELVGIWSPVPEEELE